MTYDNWGYSALWLEHPEVNPGPGSWRRFEYFMDYDERYSMVWVDGHLVADDERFVDGRIPYGPERDFHSKSFQLFYASTGDDRDYDDCVDGEGCAPAGRSTTWRSGTACRRGDREARGAGRSGTGPGRRLGPETARWREWWVSEELMIVVRRRHQAIHGDSEGRDAGRRSPRRTAAPS